MSDKCTEGIPPYKRNHPDITPDSPCQAPCVPTCCDDCPVPPKPDPPTPPRKPHEIYAEHLKRTRGENDPEYMNFLKEFVR